jgi:hypothetical protein
MITPMKNKSKRQAKIPERPEDMPGGPGGGTPIRPPDQKRKDKKKSKGPDAK